MSMLPKRYQFWRPTQYNVAAATPATGVAPLLGQTAVSWAMPRNKPIEEVLLRVRFQIVNAAAITLLANGTRAALDGLLNIVKRVRIKRPTNSQKPANDNAVDASGIFLLEYCANAGLNLSAATLTAIGVAGGATVASAMYVQLDYRIPLVPPQVVEPLRSRCMLPCHTWTESPVMEIDFENPANLYTNATAGQIGNLTVEVGLMRREPTQAYTDQVLKAGGYIPTDLVQTDFVVPAGSAAEVRVPLAQVGKQCAVQFCLYQGGANLTRNVPDVVTTPGLETIWTLQNNTNIEDSFTWSQLASINDFSRPLNSASQTTSPAIGRAVAAGTQYPIPASVMFDCLTDGFGTDTQGATEFGSVLNLDAVKAAGALYEIVGLPASVTPVASIISYGGHRVYGDLSNYMQLAV